MIKITLKPKKPFIFMSNKEKVLFGFQLVKNACENNNKGCIDCPLDKHEQCIMTDEYILPKDWKLPDDN